MLILNYIRKLLISCGDIMISYAPFYETLFKKGITEYNLIFKQGFSANTLHRMKKGYPVSTKTLDALCYALDCEISDIIKFEKE